MNAQKRPTLRFEESNISWGAHEGFPAFGRTKVPGGWILYTHQVAAMVFIPDPQHKWDGNSLP